MVQAKQTDPWDRTESRNRQTYTESTDIWQRCKGNTIEKTVFSKNGAETTGHLHVKNGSKHGPHTFHKN